MHSIGVGVVGAEGKQTNKPYTFATLRPHRLFFRVKTLSSTSSDLCRWRRVPAVPHPSALIKVLILEQDVRAKLCARVLWSTHRSVHRSFRQQRSRRDFVEYVCSHYSSRRLAFPGVDDMALPFTSFFAHHPSTPPKLTLVVESLVRCSPSFSLFSLLVNAGLDCLTSCPANHHFSATRFCGAATNTRFASQPL